jgi:hypothetical protein
VSCCTACMTMMSAGQLVKHRDNQDPRKFLSEECTKPCCGKWRPTPRWQFLGFPQQIGQCGSQSRSPACQNFERSMDCLTYLHRVNGRINYKTYLFIFCFILHIFLPSFIETRVNQYHFDFFSSLTILISP